MSDSRVKFRKNNKELRKTYAETVSELARSNPKIVDFEADLTGAGGMKDFQKEFPDRFFDVGIAEQSLITVTSGMSLTGYVPFMHTFATFAVRRPCDQIYISAAYAGANIKICGSDPGITGTLNGGTHQAMEDISILRPIPNITILEPSDHAQMKWAVKTAAENYGLFYIREYRKECDDIYAEGSEFEIGKGITVVDGDDAAIITCGAVTMREAIKASEILKSEGINVRVIDLVSIKPIDKEIIVKSAMETGAVIVCDNHYTIGGISTAVSEVLAENGIGVAYGYTGVKDSFGEVGELDYLLERFGMRAEDVAKKVKETIAKKN